MNIYVVYGNDNKVIQTFESLEVAQNALSGHYDGLENFPKGSFIVPMNIADVYLAPIYHEGNYVDEK
jgi:hypothetical protein